MKHPKAPKVRLPFPSIVELRFVDPNTWDGIGEIVTDSALIVRAKRNSVRTTTAIARLRAAGEPVHEPLLSCERYSPDEKRTQLVAVTIYSPGAKD